MTALSKSAKRTMDALEKEIKRLSERGESARGRAAEMEEEVRRIDQEIRAVSLEAFAGDEEARKEAARLEQRRSELEAGRRVARGASQTAEERLPALESELAEVKARESEALKEAELAAHKAEFEALQADREALYPKLEKQVAALAATLKEAGELANKQAALAPKAGLPNYQPRWHQDSYEFLKARLHRGCGMIVHSAQGLRGLPAPVYVPDQSPLYGRRLDGEPLEKSGSEATA